MGALDKAAEKLGLKKKPTKKDIDRSQKEIANQVKAVDNRIVAKLVTLKVEDLTHKLPQETLDKYDSIRKAFSKEFNDNAVKRLNTVHIEELSEKMVDKLQAAIHAGDTQTVSWIFQGLYYSVNEARKDIPLADMDKEEDIRERRESILEKYSTAAVVSDNMRSAIKEMESVQKKIDKIKTEFELKDKELKQLFKEKPELQAQLRNAGSPESIKTPELLMAANRVAEVYDLYYTVRDLKTQEAILDGQVSTDEQTLRELDTSLTQMRNILPDEVVETVKALQDEAAQALVDATAQKKEMQEAIDRQHKIFEGWLTNQAGELTAAYRKNLELEHIKKKQEQDRAEGIRIAQEQAAQQEENFEEQEEKQILSN